MLKKALISAALVATSVAGFALSRTTPAAPVDEPILCPFCGGAVTPQGLGVEVLRETGMRIALRSIGLQRR